MFFFENSKRMWSNHPQFFQKWVMFNPYLIAGSLFIFIRITTLFIVIQYQDTAGCMCLPHSIISGETILSSTCHPHSSTILQHAFQGAVALPSALRASRSKLHGVRGIDFFAVLPDHDVFPGSPNGSTTGFRMYLHVWNPWEKTNNSPFLGVFSYLYLE